MNGVVIARQMRTAKTDVANQNGCEGLIPSSLVFLTTVVIITTNNAHVDQLVESYALEA